MKDTSAVHNKGIGVETRFDFKSQILLKLLVQALLYVPGSHELPVFTEERGVIDREEHAHRGLVDGDRRQGLGSVQVGDSVTDLEAVDSNHRANVSATDLLDIGLAKTVEDHQLLDFMLLNNIIPLAKAHLLPGVEDSPRDLTDGDPADIRGIFKGSDLHLDGSLNHLGSRNHLKDSVQQRSDVRGWSSPVLRHPALLGASEYGLEIELLVIGVQGAHQVEDLLLHLVRTAVRLVHLIDHHYRLLAKLESFVKHETGLGHATFERVHKKQHTVGHIQHPFNLTTEIAMAWSVYNVDFNAFICDGHILGENGYTSFPLDVIVVEDELSEVLRLTHQVCLVDHPVHERRLAVVDMRDERYIPNFLHIPKKILRIY